MKISDIQRYDSKKMYEAYEKWPEIAQENYFSTRLSKIQFKNIDHIVFAGVGIFTRFLSFFLRRTTSSFLMPSPSPALPR